MNISINPFQAPSIPRRPSYGAMESTDIAIPMSDLDEVRHPLLFEAQTQLRALLEDDKSLPAWMYALEKVPGYIRWSLFAGAGVSAIAGAGIAYGVFPLIVNPLIPVISSMLVGLLGAFIAITQARVQDHKYKEQSEKNRVVNARVSDIFKNFISDLRLDELEEEQDREPLMSQRAASAAISAIAELTVLKASIPHSNAWLSLHNDLFIAQAENLLEDATGPDNLQKLQRINTLLKNSASDGRVFREIA